MRRALLTAWPALAIHYGLKPWDVEQLTMAEINEYIKQIPGA